MRSKCWTPGQVGMRTDKRRPRPKAVPAILANAILGLCLLSASGCAASVEQTLLRAWVSIDNPKTEDYPIGIVLLADGTGRVRNLPIWDGSGDCGPKNVTLYNGSVAWRSDGSTPVIGAPAGDIRLDPSSAPFLAVDWDELVLNFCGEGSPDVLMSGRRLDADEGVDILDAKSDIDWDRPS